MKKQLRATVAAASIIIAVCGLPLMSVVPIIVIGRLSPRDFEDNGVLQALMMASPGMIVPALEFNDIPIEVTGKPAMILLVHFAVFGLLAARMRSWCYARADRLLGRVAPPAGDVERTVPSW